MQRRQVLSRFAQVGGASLLKSRMPMAWAAAPEIGAAKAIPTADQIAWQDLEVGMFIHFAPNTWQDLEGDDLSTPLATIDPKRLDTDQWARTALDLGAKYIVFVAKHAGGFCMWQTRTTDYGIRNTPWKDGKGDVMAEVAASCRKHGLKLGVYVSPRDDHFGAKTGGICKTPELQTQYNAMYREQWTEILSRYGDMVEVWFDGSTATAVTDLLRKYQPRAMVFQGPAATIRWVGNEDGFAPDPCWNGIDRADAKTGTATSLNSDPDGDTWMPNEVDVSIRRPDWFWSTKNAAKVLTPDQLMSVYYRSVGRGTQLLLNIPANRDGVLADEDCASAKAFGAEVTRRFAKPIKETAGQGQTIQLRFDQPTAVNTIVLREDIAKGERIRTYRIEGFSDGLWKPLGEGTSVGHKRIHPVERTTLQAVRIVATKSAGTPALRTLAAFDTGVAPPADWNAAAKTWAADLAGEWKDNAFSLDLTAKIDEAKQYRLRFVPESGAVTALREVVLKLHDVPEPGFLKSVKGKPNELILDITGVLETVHLSGRVAGAASGQVLLEKL